MEMGNYESRDRLIDKLLFDGLTNPVEYAAAEAYMTKVNAMPRVNPESFGEEFWNSMKNAHKDHPAIVIDSYTPPLDEGEKQ